METVVRQIKAAKRLIFFILVIFKGDASWVFTGWRLQIYKILARKSKSAGYLKENNIYNQFILLKLEYC